MKANDLSGTNLGMTISLSIEGATVSDILSGVHHEADIITSSRLADPIPEYNLGRRATHLTFARFGSITVSSEATVSLL